MRSKILNKLALIGLDIIAIVVAFIGAYYFRLGTFIHSEFLFSEYFYMGLMMTPLWIIFLAYQGRYSLLEKTLPEKFKGVVVASLLGASLFPLMFYFTNAVFFSRGIILILFILGSALLFGISFLEKQINRYQAQHNVNISRMLVIGANRRQKRSVP